MDYLVPTASEIPHIEIDHLESVPVDGVDIRGSAKAGPSSPRRLSPTPSRTPSCTSGEDHEQYLPPSRLLELAGVIPA